MSNGWTFRDERIAFTVNDPEGTRPLIIPDQVGAALDDYVGTTFPAYSLNYESKKRVRLSSDHTVSIL